MRDWVKPEPPSLLTVMVLLAVMLVPVIAAAVEPPIMVPSIVPPSMSGVFTSGEVRVLFVSV